MTNPLTHAIAWLARGDNAYKFCAVMVGLVGLIIGATWPDVFPWSRSL